MHSWGIQHSFTWKFLFLKLPLVCAGGLFPLQMFKEKYFGDGGCNCSSLRSRLFQQPDIWKLPIFIQEYSLDGNALGEKRYFFHYLVVLKWRLMINRKDFRMLVDLYSSNGNTACKFFSVYSSPSIFLSIHTLKVNWHHFQTPPSPLTLCSR